ncbi:interleukin-1 receptor type 1 isoform X2 [Acinonyx jubatus]|uniref:Interleukin-1 receptor type 1 isoform X2 n=1 Tax=Acinonyx jubatus TaxID=32536 RepID=A0ABM3NAB0_ACIJB|nr:interleukin-1 receptor type 1 isoform X2 [Acinonyx jubatus]
MKVLLRLCFIAVLISSLEADTCEEREEKVVLVSSAYEIDVRSCLLNPNEKKGTIIWYKNDSKTPISMEVDSRIHQHKDKLWFVPAKVEDSGHYYCAVRNSTYCLKIKIAIKFVQHEPNLCYNAEAIFTQKLPIARDGQLVCPYLDFFRDEKHELPKIQWHKDCKPLLLDNVNFTGLTNRLIMTNVTAAHKGNYTCQASYTYLGKQYRITRVIELLTLEEDKPVKPIIVSPTNETMEASLGSRLQLICNVSGQLSDFVYWKWNGSLIDEDDPVLVEDYLPVENPSTKRKNTIITVLNISEVESRFYLYPFTCVAKNTDGINSAYIQLIHPASDGKTYDAYILYPKTLGEGSTSNSDIFVFKVLPEVLEKQCGYKLFIYGRDAYVGEDIVDVTNENIKKSRRLIIVLVPEASGLGWLENSSEEQIAMYNAFIQDGIKVVLLELETIQDYEKMPETIKFIKRKHGAIRWSGDFREGVQSAKTRFWKNVRYHMPIQRQPPPSKHQLLSLAMRPDSKKKLQREVHVPLG